MSGANRDEAEGVAAAERYREMQEKPFTDEQVEQLLFHLRRVDTKWWKVSGWLIEFGRKGLPETRDSRNPVKWTAAEIGCRMQERQTKRFNRRFDSETSA